MSFETASGEPLHINALTRQGNGYSELNKALRILRKKIREWKVPAVGVVAEQAVDRPFETLVSTILSLRTKDKVTETASRRLLARAPDPQSLVSLSPVEIEQLIYPVGFYHTKALNLLATCSDSPERPPRPRSSLNGGAPPASRRRTKNRKSGAYGRLRRLRDLRRHPRAPDFKYLGVCADKDSGRNRVCT